MMLDNMMPAPMSIIPQFTTVAFMVYLPAVRRLHSTSADSAEAVSTRTLRRFFVSQPRPYPARYSMPSLMLTQFAGRFKQEERRQG
jgi:hypothetical protein